METTEHGSMELTVPPPGQPQDGERTGGKKRRKGIERPPREVAGTQQADSGARKDAESQQDPSGGADENDAIPEEMEEWLMRLEREVGLNASFDLQVRQMTFGGQRCAFLFVSGFAKDESLTEVLKRLAAVPSDAISRDALQSLLELHVPAIQIRKTTSFREMVVEVLVGNTALYVDGESGALIIDAKQYPGRNPDQPDLEKVVRGSKDGFTETLLTNVALIRRRLRDPGLRFEIMKIGTRTQTDVCIGYIADLADRQLVESVRDKLKAVVIDGLPMADQQLEEMTVQSGWNPYPLVRYSERPDVVSAHLLDGGVTVIVDTSPSVMLLPTTYFSLIQHAEENRQNPLIGSYMRWVRFFGIWTSVFLLPLWFLFAMQPALRPAWLSFLGAEKAGELPLIVQFLLVEVGVDLMRLAAVHTPSPLVTAMSLISAILIGDIAVKTGLFVNEVILYMAVAAVGTFATPSYELGLANRLVRLALLVSVAIFQVSGFSVCASLILIGLAMKRSFNRPYLWPFLPFNAKALFTIILRQPLPANYLRPSLNRTQEDRKQPE